MIEAVLAGSLAFIMFSLGLSLKPQDFWVAFQQPKTLIAGALVQLALLPIIAFILLTLFGLQGQLAIGVMILSCCPGGITSNIMTKLSRGDVALSISYTSLASLVTAGTLPLVLSVTAPILLPQQNIELSILPLSLKVFCLATLPVLLGVWLSRVAPEQASRWELFSSRTANTLFVLVLLGALISQWDVFIANLPILGPILLLLNLLMLSVGLGIGNLLGLKQSQITSLAVEAGFQNGTIGIVVGSLISDELVQAELSRFSLPSAVYSILMMLTIIPFVLWRRYSI
ncbi:MAG: transporter [Propionibacteriaceae bacterium]|nr:transporter [Propionibacteriaceae bacterium]